jgi:5-methylcytosine-specific restriction endonuclease McrA
MRAVSSQNGLEKKAEIHGPIEEKRCPRCGETKPRALFAPAKHTTDGRQGYCKACMREYQAKHRGTTLKAMRAREQARIAKQDDDQYLALVRSDPCSYCGEPSDTLDHIVPRYVDDDDDWSNLTAACMRCNTGKGRNSLLVYLGMKLARQEVFRAATDVLAYRAIDRNEEDKSQVVKVWLNKNQLDFAA